MAGNYERRKTVRKSMVWAKHGNHATALYKLRAIERQRPQPYKPPMYSTIHEALAAAKRDRI